MRWRQEERFRPSTGPDHSGELENVSFPKRMVEADIPKKNQKDEILVVIEKWLEDDAKWYFDELYEKLNL